MRQLVNFLTTRLGQPLLPLSREVGLEGAFGIAGLDTIQLYEDFVTEFCLAVPADWSLANHVTPERLQPGCYLKRLISTQFRKATAYRDLTLGELADMVAAGHWLPPM